MATTKKTESIYKALANFQQEVPVIHKGTKGYGYSYADLPAIFEVINPLLKKHKLGFTQLLDGENIKTVLFHIETGELLESSVHIKQDVVLKGMNDFQVMGSAVTYYRRYALSAILGIVTDKDIDAGGEQQKPAKTAPQAPKSLPELKEGTPAYESVLKGLKNGFTMAQVKSKYIVSAEVEKLLTKNV